MENRFEHTPPEGQGGWGAYVTPPAVPGQQQNNAGATETQAQVGLCAHVQDLLPALIENDGQIRPEMATTLYGHLAVCKACAREFAEMKRVIQMLAALPPAEMPMDYSGLIMSRIQTEMLSVPGLVAPHPTQAAARPGFGPSVAGAATDTREIEKVIAVASPHFATGAVPSVATTTRQAAGTTAGFASAASVTPQTVAELAQETRTTMRTRERLTLAGIFSALLALAFTTTWGRALLGANWNGVSEGAGQVGDALRHVPLLNWLTVLAGAALSQAGGLVGDTYRSLGSLALQGLALDIGLCVAMYYVLVARRQRGQRLGL